MSAHDPYRRKVLIIQSRFYPDISDEIFKGAKLVLERKNVNFDSIENYKNDKCVFRCTHIIY